MEYLIVESIALSAPGDAYLIHCFQADFWQRQLLLMGSTLSPVSRLRCPTLTSIVLRRERTLQKKKLACGGPCIDQRADTTIGIPLGLRNDAESP